MRWRSISSTSWPPVWWIWRLAGAYLSLKALVVLPQGQRIRSQIRAATFTTRRSKKTEYQNYGDQKSEKRAAFSLCTEAMAQALRLLGPGGGQFPAPADLSGSQSGRDSVR